LKSGSKMAHPPADPALSTVVDVEVRYAETDQMGVVHHSNYIVWFELARTRLCAASGFHYAEVERQGYLLMVTGVEVRYRKSALYGDTVRVRAWVEQSGSRGLRFAYEIHRQAAEPGTGSGTASEDLLATGATEHVWLHEASGKPCRTPEFLRPAFDRLAGPARLARQAEGA
jgi:acyl-CoA thioester hydrolase